MKNSVDLMFFAEDPGAANIVAAMAEIFSDHKMNFFFLAEGLAVDRLRRFGSKQIERRSRSALELLEDIKPKLILVGTAENTDSLSLPLIDAAKSLGIPSIGLVDAVMNSAERFAGNSSNPLQHCPDFLFVPDEQTKRCYEKMGARANTIVVYGYPHLFLLKKRISLETPPTELRDRILRARAPRKILTFVSEGFAPLRNQHQIRTEPLLKEFLNFFKTYGEEPPFLVFRLHPKENPALYEKYLNRFDFISREEDPIELLGVSDMVVGLTSMLMTEAALMQKPVLSFVPNKEEANWLPAFSQGAVSCSFSFSEFRENLELLLKKPEAFRPSRDFLSVNSSQVSFSFVQSLLLEKNS